MRFEASARAAATGQFRYGCAHVVGVSECHRFNSQLNPETPLVCAGPAGCIQAPPVAVLASVQDRGAVLGCEGQPSIGRDFAREAWRRGSPLPLRSVGVEKLQRRGLRFPASQGAWLCRNSGEKGAAFAGSGLVRWAESEGPGNFPVGPQRGIDVQAPCFNPKAKRRSGANRAAFKFYGSNRPKNTTPDETGGNTSPGEPGRKCNVTLLHLGGAQRKPLSRFLEDPPWKRRTVEKSEATR